MNYAPQIIESFNASEVERILVVDDAFDPPELQQENAGDLLEVLEGSDLRGKLGEVDREAAIDALGEDDLDDEAIARVVSALYAQYVDTRAQAVDPGGEFAALKGSALEALDPLVELLSKCRDRSKIQLVGKGTASQAYTELRPNLILMDFFLSPPERTTRAETRGQSDGDRERSISLLRSILEGDPEATPAVILMSSEKVGERAQAYRGRLDGRVTALRFGFLDKEWINGTGDGLTASGDAADVLMEMSGSFEFVRTLEKALRQWKDGAQEGLKKLYEELGDFDIKDFAYLLRFRLYEEGEPFADYLEWFLGESLRAIVDDNVNWNTDEYLRLNEEKLTEAIEGADPVLSERIATFFHRMRFNSRENRTRKRLAFGDLFVASNNRTVRMVITPDCDMVLRNGTRRATRALTVGGTIRGMGEDRALASELIFHGNPKAIKWNFKDLMSHEFRDIENLRVDETSYSYFASMRAMSAQTIQKTVLADLSRVGLAVPPTVYVGAPVRVYVKKNVDNQARVVELEGLEEARAQVFMPRGGEDTQKRALFTRKFVRELVARLSGMDGRELAREHDQHRRNCLNGTATLRKAMLREGLDLPGEIFKIAVSVGNKRGKNWLEIVVDVSDEALIRSHGTDPLA